MPRLRAVCVPLLCAALTVGGLAPASASSNSSSRVGARGAGDPYYPRQGNGGYDVRHYRLGVRYYPKSHRLRGVATIFATATQDLSRFDLDLRTTMKVSSVRVNGHRASARQPAKTKQELVIRPSTMLRKKHRFQVQVHYSGVAKSITDPDGALDGWIWTKDGAFVASEPQGSPTWFPVNDSPRDKATYRVSVNVPKRLAAISNGALKSRHTKHGRTTWTWRIDQPISSYLVTATIGKFDITRGRTRRGVPYLIAIDPTQRSQSGAVLRDVPKIVDYFSRKYGKYPFAQTGAIVDNAPNVGYALEVASRPLFDRAPDVLTIAHELAHEWYGDGVTLKRWRDIWLNEGFAEFSSWLWDEHRGGKSAAQHLRELMSVPAGSSSWNPPPANPGSAAQVFAGSVYDRGAGALEALRQRLGDSVFFKIMRGWFAAHRYGNATVPQFVRYAQQVSHRNLTKFFHRWLYKHGKP